MVFIEVNFDFSLCSESNQIIYFNPLFCFCAPTPRGSSSGSELLDKCL